MDSYFFIIEWVWNEWEFNFLAPTRLINFYTVVTFELIPSINLIFALNDSIVS
jgi:hypothetical protein